VVGAAPPRPTPPIRPGVDPLNPLRFALGGIAGEVELEGVIVDDSLARVARSARAPTAWRSSWGSDRCSRLARPGAPADSPDHSLQSGQLVIGWVQAPCLPTRHLSLTTANLNGQLCLGQVASLTRPPDRCTKGVVGINHGQNKPPPKPAKTTR